jgi:hypothetical protein
MLKNYKLRKSTVQDLKDIICDLIDDINDSECEHNKSRFSHCSNEFKTKTMHKLIGMAVSEYSDRIGQSYGEELQHNKRIYLKYLNHAENLHYAIKQYEEEFDKAHEFTLSPNWCCKDMGVES